MTDLSPQSRKIQLVGLNLLSLFIKICTENNLRYYVIGGSLIGILRHKGFIPWDDDIDIGMPRKDYEKFLSICNHHLPSGYEIKNYQNNLNWNFALSQLIDLETKISIFMNEIPRQTFMWIDIFPLDGLPYNGLKKWFHIKKILFYRYLIQLVLIKEQVDKNKLDRPFCEKLILKIFKNIPFKKNVNIKKLLIKLEKTLKKYDFDESYYAGNMLGRYREKEAVLKEYFGEPKYMTFENLIVAVPKMAHELQTSLYGNYMDLPPENKRINHRIEILKIRKFDNSISL